MPSREALDIVEKALYGPNHQKALENMRDTRVIHRDINTIGGYDFAFTDEDNMIFQCIFGAGAPVFLEALDDIRRQTGHSENHVWAQTIAEAHLHMQMGEYGPRPLTDDAARRDLLEELRQRAIVWHRDRLS